MTQDKTPTDALELCPFCGAGDTQVHVNKGTWNGRGYGEPVSVEVRHWCTAVPGQPSRMISRAGRDEASAIAAWNTRRGSPVVAGEPVEKLWLWKNFVGGKPEYWAFDNPFPCVSVGGDPLTFGEPCGWALLKPSVNGRPQRSEQEVANTVSRLHTVPQPTQAQEPSS